jgi:hypothetical protein
MIAIPSKRRLTANLLLDYGISTLDPMTRLSVIVYAAAGTIVIEVFMRGVNQLWRNILHPRRGERSETRSTKRRTVCNDIDCGVILIVGDGEFHRPGLSSQRRQLFIRRNMTNSGRSHSWRDLILRRGLKVKPIFFIDINMPTWLCGMCSAGALMPSGQRRGTADCKQRSPRPQSHDCPPAHNRMSVSEVYKVVSELGRT